MASLASRSDSSKLALAAACFAGFLWGTGALVVNVLIARHGFSPETISFWRFVVGAAVLIAVFGRPSLWIRLRPQLLLVLGAGTCMALYVLCWFLGIERIGAAVPTLIALCLPPVLVTLLAVFRGRERLDAGLVAVLGAALLGTVLIVLRHGGGHDAVAPAVLWLGIGFFCRFGAAVCGIHAGQRAAVFRIGCGAVDDVLDGGGCGGDGLVRFLPAAGLAGGGGAGGLAAVFGGYYGGSGFACLQLGGGEVESYGVDCGYLGGAVDGGGIGGFAVESAVGGGAVGWGFVADWGYLGVESAG